MYLQKTSNIGYKTEIKIFCKRQRDVLAKGKQPVCGMVKLPSTKGREYLQRQANGIIFSHAQGI